MRPVTTDKMPQPFAFVRYIPKALRFVRIYGPGRTFFKILGRAGVSVPIPFGKITDADIGIIGCGQFGFSTIGYFISRSFGRRFLWCFDVNRAAEDRFARVFGVRESVGDLRDRLNDTKTRFVYIASNHASHTPYAIQALAAGKVVYVEKPIAVTVEQLRDLSNAVASAEGKIFSGYNRPFSGAIRYLREHLDLEREKPISMQCFVAGHQIPADHWYRDDHEGTRICGNAGHWIDLFIHILSWGALPDRYYITLAQADISEPDDNFCLTITTDAGDIFSLLLSSRSEPFEGINETINFQRGDVTCKIDDFRHLTLWKREQRFKKSFWPKDVGHRLAILQPFRGDILRDWNEVVCSTILTLRVAEMVRTDSTSGRLSMSGELEGLRRSAALS